jgi:hypothetical protein
LAFIKNVGGGNVCFFHRFNWFHLDLFINTKVAKRLPVCKF